MRLTRINLRPLTTPVELGRLVYPKSDLKEFREPADEEIHPLTKLAKSPRNRQEQLPSKLSDRISDLTLEWDPQEVRQKVAKLYSDLQSNVPLKPAENFLDVTAQITGLFLHNFISLRRCMKEIQKRTPNFSPKSQLDVGFGPATGVLAGNEVWPGIEYKKAVVYGTYEMKNKAKLLVEDIPNVVFTDALPTKTSPQTFDLITCTNQLYKKSGEYTSYIEQLSRELSELLNPGGIIVFIENGGPLGFESVVSMRSALLGHPVNPTAAFSAETNTVNAAQNKEATENAACTENIKRKDKFSVVGPCTHTKRCPLSFGLENRLLAKNPGKYNWCSFSQNIQRPKYTLELKKGQYLSQTWQEGQLRGAGGSALRGNGRTGGRNYETANFSWVALSKDPVAADAADAADATATEATITAADATTVDATEAIEAVDVDAVDAVDAVDVDVKAVDVEANKGDEWPRVLRDPLKRHKHVIMEVCTNGSIEQWTVPRSFGHQVYNDATRVSEMDLWPFGAKTKQHRGGLPDTLWTKLRELNSGSKLSKKRIKAMNRKADRLNLTKSQADLESKDDD